MELLTLELKKARSLGELISDSFIFLRIHMRALIGPYLLVTLPLAFLAIFPVMSYSHAITGGLMSQTPSFNYTHFSELIGSFTVMTLVFSLSFVAGISVLLAYIELWLASPDAAVLPTFGQTMSAFGKRFPKILVSSIPLFLILVLLSCLLIIPGIWFSVISFIFYPVLILEGGSFSQSLTRSRYLVNESWWQSFLIIFIASLLVGMISGFISLFFTIFMLVGKLNSTEKPTLDTSFFLITFIPAILRIVLQLYIFVAVVLQYFNLREEKDGSSLTSRIASLGTSVAPTSIPTGPKEEF